MTGVVRVEAVGIHLIEHLCTSIIEREEAGEGVEVDDWYRPNIARLLDSLHILIEEDATYVLVAFVWLDVLVAAAEIGTMDRCHDDDLLGRVHLLQLRHGGIDAAFERVAVHGKAAMAALHHFAWLMESHLYAVETLRVPFTDGHTVVIVVGAHEDEDGIEVVAVLLLQLVGLARNVVPLSAAYAINVRGDAEPLLQESPVLHLRSLDVGVGDGVSEVSYLLATPRVVGGFLSYFFLCGFLLLGELWLLGES